MVLSLRYRLARFTPALPFSPSVTISPLPRGSLQIAQFSVVLAITGYISETITLNDCT